MKKLLTIFSMLSVAGFFTACEKADTLPLYGEGTAPVLSASSTTLAPAPADSNNTALTLSWSNPKYATDSATYKYVVEMDST
ncbi:MAG TPA: SusE domain-containing protein, partial [Chitinophagaceae bacterium]|nr:SusE domain-containing protein [Chitinophagaceae bacterium]